MNLPADTLALLVQFEKAFPLPQGTPGKVHEANCRNWSIKFAQQAKFTFPERWYGVKTTSSSMKLDRASKDSLAQNHPTGLKSWDLMIGAGTGKPTLAKKPKFHDIPDQFFIEVEAVDHLSGVPAPAPTPPAPVPPAPQPPQAAKPAHPYGEHVPLGRALGRAFLEGYDEPFAEASIVEGITEAVAHLLWRYQFEKAPASVLLEDARARGVAARG